MFQWTDLSSIDCDRNNGRFIKNAEQLMEFVGNDVAFTWLLQNEMKDPKSVFNESTIPLDNEWVEAMYCFLHPDAQDEADYLDETDETADHIISDLMDTYYPNWKILQFNGSVEAEWGDILVEIDLLEMGDWLHRVGGGYIFTQVDDDGTNRYILMAPREFPLYLFNIDPD